MAAIYKFEDLDIWQLARELCRKIFIITEKRPFSNDYRFKNQIRAAAASIMDNIAEGFERNGNREFIQHLSISKGSAGEVRSQLYRALDQNYIDRPEFEQLYTCILEVSSKISNFMAYLNKSDMKGSKFKDRK